MVDRSQLKIPRVEPLDVSTLPRKMPKIEIDYSKCTVPMWCKRCLENCPQLVYKVYCVEMNRGMESDAREPGVYEVLPVRRDKCTMCNKCVEVCPEGAITITYDETVLKGEKQWDTVEAAQKSDYDLWVAPRPFSFELNTDMLDLLREEFDPPQIVARFANAIKGKDKKEVATIAGEMFGEYGKNWMKKVRQLGEEYSDRTYEVMMGMIDEVGELFFPLVPQRFIEIAYLSTQEFLKLTVLENWIERLIYQVPNCYMYRQLQEQCGEDIAMTMPCKDACLNGLDTLCRDFDLDVTIGMDSETAKDGVCQFRITRA